MSTNAPVGGTPYEGTSGPNPRTLLFTSALKRLWPLALVAAICGALLGGVAGVRAGGSHTASALVLLNPLDGNAYYPSTRGEQLTNLATESQVLRSNDVAAAVGKAVAPGVDINELLTNVSVTNPMNTQILDIRYTDRDEGVAVRRAQGFADQFLTYRRNRATVSVNNRVTALKAELAKYDAELNTLTGQLAKAAPGSAGANLLGVQVQSVGTRISQLNAQMSDVTATSRDAGQVITPAKPLKGGSLGTAQLMVIAGALIGLALVAAFAWFRSRPRGRVRSAPELRSLGVQPLAFLPGSLNRTASLGEEESAEELDDWSAALGTRLMSMLHRERRKSVLITAAHRHAGHPASVCRLAHSLAVASVRTVVVDFTGDVFAGAPGHSIGLAQVLREQVPVQDALQPLGPNLRVIRPGDTADDGWKLFVSARMRTVLAAVEQDADVILVAATSLLEPDVQSLASDLGLVVIEVEPGSTTHEDLVEAQRVSASHSVKLLGALMLRPPRRRVRKTTAVETGHPVGEDEPRTVLSSVRSS